MGRVTSLHDATIGRAILKRARRICPTSIDYFRSSRCADLARELSQHLEPVPNGVDSATYCPGPVDPAVRMRFGLPESGFLLLFVGSMDRAHYFKGVPTFLRALANVPHVAALLVGDGDLRENYQRQASELGLDRRVRFAGRVDACDLPAIYRSADALVLPSETRGEAFGVVLLEAMASGKPVIATDLPGVRTVVRNGVDGFLVPPRSPERLARQIRDLAEIGASRRHEIGMEGRRKVEASTIGSASGISSNGSIDGPVRDSRGQVSVSSKAIAVDSNLPIEVRAAIDLVAHDARTPAEKLLERSSVRSISKSSSIDTHVIATLISESLRSIAIATAWLDHLPHITLTKFGVSRPAQLIAWFGQ